MIPMKYLNFVHLCDLFNWSVAYHFGTEHSYSDRYPLVALGVFLFRSKNIIDVKDDIVYKRVTISTMGKGVSVRDERKGKNIGTKKQYRINSGQFLVSKIDARNGAFGVVPLEADNAIITGNFWAYDVDYNLIDPHYLALITRTQEFTSFCEKASNGTTNRHYLQEALFLSQQIPLPSLDEQRTIIQKHLNKNNQAKEIETAADKVVKKAQKWLMDNLGIYINEEIKSHNILQFIRYKSLEKWSISEIQRYNKYSYEEAKYKVAKIGDIILSFEGGKTPSTKCKEYWGEDVYWVSAKDMKELYLSNIQDKLSQKGVEDTKLKVYPQGTILGVFRSGILRHSFPVCITTHPVTINQDLKAFGIDERKVNKLYFLFYLNLLQDIVLSVAMKKGVTVESINTDAFMEIPFVCPPIEKQNEIVAHITALLDEQKNLRQQATELRQQAQQQFEQTIFN